VKPTSDWQRRLWNTGLCLTLREVIEACDALNSGELSVGAVTWLAESTRRKIHADPEQRKTLAESLRGTRAQTEHRTNSHESPSMTWRSTTYLAGATH
jgi:hypothetical protein